MKITHIISNKAIFSLFLTFFFFLLILFYHSLFMSDGDSEKLTSSFQEELSEKEISIDKILVELSKTLIEKNQDHIFASESLSQILSENDFTILVYTYDSLSFWSDNLIPFEEDKLFTDPEISFIKLPNGYYVLRNLVSEKYTIVGLIKIKSDFLYENQFLSNDFGKSFHLNNLVEITETGQIHQLFNLDGKFLFSLDFTNSKEVSVFHQNIFAILYILLLVFIIVTVYKAYQALLPFYKSKYILVIGFIIDVIIIRFITIYFEIPTDVYSTFLFSPESFAFSAIFSSLGDLLINAVMLLSIAYVIHRNINYGFIIKSYSASIRFILFFILIFVIGFLYFLLTKYLYGLVINSNISLNLNDITSINFYSVIGFVNFALLILAFVFFTVKLALKLSFLFSNKIIYYSLLLISGGFYIVILRFFTDVNPISVIFIFVYLVSFPILFKDIKGKTEISFAIFYLLLFSIFSTYVLSESNKTKEFEQRKISAHNIAMQRDPIAEYKFIEIADEIKSDSVLVKYLSNYPFQSQDDYDSIYNYLLNNYFADYWTKYDFFITICDENRLLDIQPEDYVVNCYEYFTDIVAEYGQPTACDNFYYIDYYMLSDNYLGLVNFDLANIPFQIAIEVIPKNNPKGLGYPELLVDSKNPKSAELSLYSWAMYEKNELVYHFGKYFYSINLSNYGSFDESISFFSRNKFSHLNYRISNDTVIVISKKEPGILEVVAPFSYIFIFYGLILFILLLILKDSLNIRMLEMNFKKRVQFSLTALIVVSFLIIGFGSLYYIVKLNDNKNHDILNEKAHSVLIELEHKLASEDALSPEIETYLSDLLYKFSLVFFSDINMYDLNGTLLATSRPEIFNKGLISTKMNSGAFNYMKNQKKSFYIHHESIGDYEYLSAYVPFRNDQNKLIAYLNLPYFAKQDELTKEISTFLVAFINIYVILIAVAIFIALVISNYITRPVQLIKEKIGGLRLGGANDKIEWDRNDEIGSLVHEYNRMVDELTQSAELLAKSERESAWREMARQIAHEIKNPLTPMKLSVQYLQKAYDEKAPDWDQRLKKFTKTIVEQIDSLSIIASEFSDFATLPKSKYQKSELTEIIQNTINLFSNTTDIKIDFHFSQQHFVFADKEQISRVFINLIKNSIQAIDNPQDGNIGISIEQQENVHIIRFKDNGSGIPEDQIEKVFYPNFTTKTGGMGLGLAMVKSIVQNTGGDITFNSQTGEGTTFIISLPDYEG